MLARERFGRTLVEIMDGYVVCTLPDGAQVFATPQHAPEDVARAHALGYNGDVWAMTCEHDPAHAALASWLSLKESPALRCAFNRQNDLPNGESELAGAEEEVVLALQRYINMLRKEGLLP